jgi:hypothetical protein
MQNLKPLRGNSTQQRQNLHSEQWRKRYILLGTCILYEIIDDYTDKGRIPWSPASDSDPLLVNTVTMNYTLCHVPIAVAETEGGTNQPKLKMSMKL